MLCRLLTVILCHGFDEASKLFSFDYTLWMSHETTDQKNTVYFNFFQRCFATRVNYQARSVFNLHTRKKYRVAYSPSRNLKTIFGTKIFLHSSYADILIHLYIAFATFHLRALKLTSLKKVLYVCCSLNQYTYKQETHEDVSKFEKRTRSDGVGHCHPSSVIFTSLDMNSDRHKY